eukprot:2632112-Amphidinium_carterae.1
MSTLAGLATVAVFPHVTPSQPRQGGVCCVGRHSWFCTVMGRSAQLRWETEGARTAVHGLVQDCACAAADLHGGPAPESPCEQLATTLTFDVE